MNQSELAELDLKVAQTIQRLNPESCVDYWFYIKDEKCFIEEPPGTDEPLYWHPTTNPDQAYRIIEKHKIKLDFLHTWEASLQVDNEIDNWVAGSTPLEAAMKAFVESKELTPVVS